MTNHPQKGAWFGSHDPLLHVQLFLHGTLLSEVNNAVDSEILLLAPMPVDASDAIQ